MKSPRRVNSFRGLRLSPEGRGIRRPSGKSIIAMVKEKGMGNDVLVERAKLRQAVDTLAEELLFIKSSLDTYCVIGLNCSKIESGTLTFGHLQRLSLQGPSRL
jgi:hypothetical protein